MSAAAIFARQNRFIRLFEEAGATTPAAAVAPQQLGIRPSWIFNRMASAGVFIDVGDGRYYLDIPASRAFRSRRRTKVLTFAAIALLIFLLYLLITSY